MQWIHSNGMIATLSFRLTCSVLRLHQTMDAVDLSHAIKYRRDVCFSQALTSLISALMARSEIDNGILPYKPHFFVQEMS